MTIKNTLAALSVGIVSMGIAYSAHAGPPEEGELQRKSPTLRRMTLDVATFLARAAEHTASPHPTYPEPNTNYPSFSEVSGKVLSWFWRKDT